MQRLLRLALLAAVFLGVWPVLAAEDAETLIRRKLAERASLTFEDTPLSEALATLKNQQRLTLVVDKRALEDEGVELSTSVSLDVRDVSLGAGLRLLLQPLGLTTVVQHEALVLTTQAKAADLLERRVYGILDLIPDRDEQNAQAAEQLRDLVRTTVAPASWIDTGGKGSVRALHGMLVVSQSQDVHREVESLLASLRAIHKPAAPAAELSAVAKALAKKVSLDWKDQPLNKALAATGAEHRAQILIDRPGLEEAGIRADQPVTVQFQDMTLGSALTLALAPLSLAFVEQDEVLMIVTDAKAKARQERRLFDVRDLSKAPGEVLDVVLATVAPESWERQGGPGAAREYAGHLVVWQTPERSRQIAALLAEMRSVRRGQQEGTAVAQQPAEKQPETKQPEKGPDAKAPDAPPSKEAVAAYTKGTQLVADLEYKQAVGAFSDAIKLAPKYARAYRSRGHAYYAIQQYENSVKDYTFAIGLEPKNADAYFERGRAYKALEMLDRSKEDREMAIKLDPSLKDYDYE